MSSKQTSKYSTSELRNFYFSKATKYPATKPTSEGGAKKIAGKELPAKVATPGLAGDNSTNVSMNAISVDVSAGSPADATTGTVVASPIPAESNTGVPAVAGSARALVKDRATTSTALTTTNGNTINTSVTNGVGAGDSVSPNYIAFLKQQQDLVKSHNQIDQQLAGMLKLAAEQRDINLNDTAGAESLLHEAEDSTGWNWKSKFNKESVTKDANLQVPFSELCAEDDIPNVIDLQHQHQQLVKLRQDHCTNKDSHAAFRLTLENGIRRFDRLIKEFSQSQLDASPVVRLSDKLLVQLDQMLGIEPLPVTLQDCNDRIVVLAQKQQECMKVRAQAFDDGEMHIAERETFRLVDLSEELAAAQIAKIQLLEKAREENAVGNEMRDVHLSTAQQQTLDLEAKTADLRSRSETDLARLYKLKQEVDETDNQLDDKWQEECRRSNDMLGNIQTRQTECWDQIESLVKQLRQLEMDRHQECKRRVEEKVRNETRKIEYRRFCEVADGHAATLDRTIRNCDTKVHCTKLMAEFLQSGFYTIQKDLTEKRSEIDSSLLDAHKSHLEIFRSLLFTLADLEYKRERRLEEVQENVHAAHIQQELCSDSLNPNAKKFSDAKRELLRVHDELELELQDIRERISTCTDQFKPSESALVEANVEHRHPVDEMEERRVNTRVKMVNFKAMSLGNVSAAPLKEELETLKRDLQDTKRTIQNSRSGSRAGSRIEG